MATPSPEPLQSSQEISQPPFPPVAQAIPQESTLDFERQRGHEAVKWEAKSELYFCRFCPRFLSINTQNPQ